MKAILASATQDENGVWGGKLPSTAAFYTDMNATGGVKITMSSFSSWGVPGDLSLKPRSRAPAALTSIPRRTDGNYGLMSGTSTGVSVCSRSGSRCQKSSTSVRTVLVKRPA